MAVSPAWECLLVYYLVEPGFRHKATATVMRLPSLLGIVLANQGLHNIHQDSILMADLGEVPEGDQIGCDFEYQLCFLWKHLCSCQLKAF